MQRVEEINPSRVVLDSLAEFRLLAANLNQNRVLQDIVFQVEQAYYRVLGLELLVRVNELSLQNLRTSLDAAQRRRESGLDTDGAGIGAEQEVGVLQRRGPTRTRDGRLGRGRRHDGPRRPPAR